VGRDDELVCDRGESRRRVASRRPQQRRRMSERRIKITVSDVVSNKVTITRTPARWPRRAWWKVRESLTGLFDWIRPHG
jgi:hypothetical protein